MVRLHHTFHGRTERRHLGGVHSLLPVHPNQSIRSVNEHRPLDGGISTELRRQWHALVQENCLPLGDARLYCRGVFGVSKSVR